MPKPIDAEERQKIVDLLHEHGGNRTKVAQIAKRSRQTVCNIADAAGIPVIDSQKTKKAVEARKAFSDEKRTELIAASYEKYEELLKACTDAQDFQRLQVAWGIMVDKDLLLRGKPTNISENRKGNEVGGLFSELKGKADEQWKR